MSGLVYVMVPVGGDSPVKVGRTMDISQRHKNIQACSPVKLRIHAVVEPSNRDHVTVEAEAHKALREFRMHGEWFKCTTWEATRAIVKACGAFNFISVETIDGARVKLNGNSEHDKR